MNYSFEAWMDRTAPIEIAKPLYTYTTTTIVFSVINSARSAIDLTGYAAKFAMQKIDDETTLLDQACTITDAAAGQCTAAITATDLDEDCECLGELRLWSTGDTNDDCTHRVQFRVNVVGVLVTK